MKRYFILLILLIILGISYFLNFMNTDRPSQQLLNNGEFKRLTDSVDFPETQEALKAIIAELENIKENPKEFFVKFEPDFPAPKLSFVLMHQDSLKKTHIPGNPSGKDRNAIYDPIQKRVTFLLYQ